MCVPGFVYWCFRSVNRFFLQVFSRLGRRTQIHRRRGTSGIGCTRRMIIYDRAKQSDLCCGPCRHRGEGGGGGSEGRGRERERERERERGGRGREWRANIWINLIGAEPGVHAAEGGRGRKRKGGD